MSIVRVALSGLGPLGARQRRGWLWVGHRASGALVRAELARGDRGHFISREFSDADIDARGLGDGLGASRSNGRVHTVLVGGDVDVRVGVGDIELSVDQREYAAVELESDVGRVRLEAGGYDVRPAVRRGAGQGIRMSGPGMGTPPRHS